MSKFLTPPVWYDKNGNLNDMLTGEASENGVAVGSGADATMGGVAVGYNAGADDGGVAIGHNANTRGGVAIGGDATEGGVAIQGTVTGTATGAGVAIQGTATGNGIAIGGNAAENNVQLGKTDTAYDLTVGNGSGTLNIGGIAGIPEIISIAFKKQTISGDVVAIGTQGVYLCCITDTGDNSQSYVAICFIDSRNKPASVLSSAEVCYYSNANGFIAPKNGYIIKYCFKIVSL